MKKKWKRRQEYPVHLSDVEAARYRKTSYGIAAKKSWYKNESWHKNHNSYWFGCYWCIFEKQMYLFMRSIGCRCGI